MEPYNQVEGSKTEPSFFEKSKFKYSPTKKVIQMILNQPIVSFLNHIQQINYEITHTTLVKSIMNWIDKEIGLDQIDLELEASDLE